METQKETMETVKEIPQSGGTYIHYIAYNTAQGPK